MREKIRKNPSLWYHICTLLKNSSDNGIRFINWYNVHLNALRMNSSNARIYVGKHGQCGFIFDHIRYTN